jgi:energy-coupling factor transporter ATP-binding protein EcfA2
MGIKIKQLSISGLRGVKTPLILPLNERSVLLYGDNGTGKSSISDSLEWFYTDSVAHLSSSEIDLKDALRNCYLDVADTSFIKINYNKSILDGDRNLTLKRGKLTSEFSNTSDEFKSYLSQSSNENLLLRYQFLRDFIDQTKGDKLKILSDIIGFSEVTKTKDILKKSFNSLKTEIKNQNFENQINTQKQTLIEKIGAAVSREENLFERINEIIAPYKTGIEIKEFTDIDKILNHIKAPVNNKLLSELSFLESCKTTFESLKNETDFIHREYVKYFTEFDKIANDVQGIMQTFLADLLNVGKKVLDKKYHKDESCPLCLQPKNIEDLKLEISARLKEIEESSKKKISFDNAKQSILLISDERIKRIDAIAANVLINDTSNSSIKLALGNIKSKVVAYQSAGNEKVTSGNKINVADDLKLQVSDFSILDVIGERVTQIQDSLKNDNTTILYSNISAAKDAFLKIKKFEVERTKLEAQKNSFEVIYNEFVKKQKEGLENFINEFSGTINDFYQYMNPGELFEEIKIVTIGDEDELNGITIEYSYNDQKVSPPQKYFSESHLNCFGISFFLASVIAFNRENRFIVLDDVISSFDSNHRKRFADLLFEKFKDWQIILLTHEEEWFQYIRQLAKRNSWLINEVKWHDKNKTTYLEEKPNDIRELIENSIASGNIDLLGNPIRKYLEHILKNICLNLEVKLSFRYNDVNEKRMPDEMLNELKSKINKCSSELKAKLPAIDRLASSSQLGNLLSHDNSFNPKIGDLKAFWGDILEFEKIFICQDVGCKMRNVSLKNYDTVLKTVHCGCGKTNYDWRI